MNLLAVAMLLLAGVLVLNTVALIRINRLLGAVCRHISQALYDAPRQG